MPGLKETGRPFTAGPEACRAKLFTHGGSQAVRLPKAFRFEGSEVLVRRDGEKVILEPLALSRPRTSEEWTAFWKAIDDLGPSTLEAPERDRTPWRDPPVFGPEG